VPLTENDAGLNRGQRQNLAILHRIHPHHAAKRHNVGVSRVARGASHSGDEDEATTTTHLRGPSTGPAATPAAATPAATLAPTALPTTLPEPSVPLASAQRKGSALVMCSSAQGHVAPASQSLANGQRLVVFAAAVRPWRSDVVMAATLFDPSHLEFLWGDHLVTKESAARRAGGGTVRV
jgi:hypothetical protein